MKKALSAIFKFCLNPWTNIVFGILVLTIVVSAMYDHQVNWVSFACGIMLCMGYDWLDYGLNRILSRSK